MNKKPRIAIIGAGPIGLEAALYARLKGYEVTVFEQGRVAENVGRWGHVKMFSPFGMNTSEWGRATVESVGAPRPKSDAILTGHEFGAAYLHVIARCPQLKSRIRCETACAAIVRHHQLKTDHIGSPRRSDTPFLLLTCGSAGERSVEADVVLDCSGSFGNPNPLGASGAACPGEAECADVIQSAPPDLEHSYVTEARGDVLVLGSGHSAATTIVGLNRLKQRLPGFPLGRVYWVTRHESTTPIARIPRDSLSERDRLAEAANRMARDPDGGVEWISGCDVQRLDRLDSGRVGVTIESIAQAQTRVVEVDRMIANVGYRPDRSLYEELQVHECYATQGPMKLAAKLLGETSADCLDQTSHGADVLRNPEPNFYIVGMKSYGRSSNFLLQIGLQQIVDVFSLIEQDWGL